MLTLLRFHYSKQILLTKTPVTVLLKNPFIAVTTLLSNSAALLKAVVIAVGRSILVKGSTRVKYSQQYKLPDSIPILKPEDLTRHFGHKTSDKCMFSRESSSLLPPDTFVVSISYSVMVYLERMASKFCS